MLILKLVINKVCLERTFLPKFLFVALTVPTFEEKGQIL